MKETMFCVWNSHSLVCVCPLGGFQVTGVHSCGQPSPGEFISLSVEENRPAASSLDGDVS